MDAVVPQQRRVWNVGDTAMFPFRVADSAGNPIQLLPGYPQYSIISPSGLPVDTGVATALPTPGHFTVNWTVPLQAELSTPNVPWRVVIQIITARRHERELEYTFDVRQTATDTTEKRDIIEACLEGQDYRAFWRGDAEPDSISLQCYYTANPGTGSDPLPVQLDKSSLTRAVHGTDVVFFYDIPASAFQNGTQTMFQNQFTLLWTTRDTPTSETMTQYQQIRIMKRNGFELVAGVRMMVDRFQHRLGTAYHISDGDICESLVRGLDHLNGWFPVTDPPYAETMVPPAMRTYWIMLSCWWLLSSQYMLAGQLAFDFCVEETTWVRTDMGMYQIRDLNDFSLYSRLMLEAILFDVDEDDFKSLVGGRIDVTQALRIVESVFGTTAGDDEAPARQQAFASTIVAAAPVTEVDDRREHLFPHRRLDTPLGVQTPSAVWDLGLRKLHRMRTVSGYEIAGTHNHPVLTLDRNLDVQQVHLADVTSMHAVALNTQAEPDSDFELKLAHLQSLADVACDSDIEVPDVLNANLVRVLGYCNRNPHMVDDTGFHATCFRTRSGNDPRPLSAARLLLALGARATGIPWSVMAAPKPLAALYLREMFDAAGVFVNAEPTWFEDVQRELSCAMLFQCGNSGRRNDLQQLLLRFGVMSEAGVDDTVLVLDSQVSSYAKAVGFGVRGSAFVAGHAKAQPDFPAWVGTAVADACGVLVLPPRTYAELESLIAEHAHEIDDKVVARVLALLEHRFTWLSVADVQEAGLGRVLDPTLPVQRDGSLPDPLTNLFYTNSIVTHNSGQSISLSQDLTGTLDSAISRLVDWLNTHLTPAKLTLYRRASAVGAIGVRPARIVGPNARTYKMDSSVTGTVGGPPNLQAVAQILGILS